MTFELGCAVKLGKQIHIKRDGKMPASDRDRQMAPQVVIDTVISDVWNMLRQQIQIKRDGKMPTSDHDNWGMVPRVIDTVISDVWNLTRLYMLSLMFARVDRVVAATVRTCGIPGSS
ncbi:hypothetical protein QYE76_061122 [Lolium multiflorum]|uniref:Uncharacterized protein n=1 Tax=Lolium multiflorum TaxID=4521 RepID=A0AAD8S3E7_LOLMU|nr:hypothetical protein QYE76_061122 [Lolium multiflorum]